VQIFVDPSRSRLRWLRRGGWGAGALAAGYVGLVVVSLMGACAPQLPAAEAVGPRPGSRGVAAQLWHVDATPPATFTGQARWPAHGGSPFRR